MDIYSKKIIKNAFETIIIMNHMKRLDKDRYKATRKLEPFKGILELYEETKMEYDDKMNHHRVKPNF